MEQHKYEEYYILYLLSIYQKAMFSHEQCALFNGMYAIRLAEFIPVLIRSRDTVDIFFSLRKIQSYIYSALPNCNS